MNRSRKARGKRQEARVKKNCVPQVRPLRKGKRQRQKARVNQV
ncbi:MULTISPECIES: hypothetical protein [Moorena]|nr:MULTISPECIES: hypothetical protein [Moorena]